MPVIVIAAIGTRDLRYRFPNDDSRRFYPLGGAQAPKNLLASLAHIFACSPNLRDLSAALLNRYGTERDSIRCPILMPALRSVIELEGTIDRLCFIVTDQPETAGPRRANDTIEAARLIARWIGEKFQGQIGETVPDLLVIRRNPHVHDEMYSLLGTELRHLIPPGQDTNLYVLISGGTPAITDALRQQAMYIYNGECAILHVDEPLEGQDLAAEGEVRQVILDPYTRDLAARSAQALIRAFNYAGAIQILRGFDRGWRYWPPELRDLLHYAAVRINMNFTDARSQAGQLMRAGSQFEWLRDSLPGPGLEDRIPEIFFLIQMAVEQKLLFDALSRIGLFVEACRTIFSFTQLGLDQYIDGNLIPKADLQTINPTIATELVRQKADATGDGSCWKVSGRTLWILFNQARVLAMSNNPTWKALTDFLRSDFLRNVVEVRHRATHFGDGISMNRLAKVLSPQNLNSYYCVSRLSGTAAPDDCLAAFLQKLHSSMTDLLALRYGRSVPPNPYPEINRQLIELLE